MKVIKVITCKTCPYFMFGHSTWAPENKDWCTDSKRYIIKSEMVEPPIPDWCKLEDLTFFIGTDDAYISNKSIHAWVCICKTTCPNGCHGECGCNVCLNKEDE